MLGDLISGIDEVGRGSVFGPLPGRPRSLTHVDGTRVLSTYEPRTRDLLFLLPFLEPFLELFLEYAFLVCPFLE